MLANQLNLPNCPKDCTGGVAPAPTAPSCMHECVVIHKHCIKAASTHFPSDHIDCHQSTRHVPCLPVHNEHPHQNAAFHAMQVYLGCVPASESGSLIIAQSTIHTTTHNQLPGPLRHTDNSSRHRQSQQARTGSITRQHNHTPHEPSQQHCSCAALHLPNTHRCILAGRKGGRTCMDSRQLNRGRK